MLRSIDRDVTVRRVRSHWCLWSVSFLWPTDSSSLINPYWSGRKNQYIYVYINFFLLHLLTWTACAQWVWWFKLFLHLQINMVQPFSAAKTVHHNREKTPEPSDSNCSPSRAWHPREPQWRNHPKTPSIISCLWVSVVHPCSRIGVETDLWLLNLQVIKSQRVAGWDTNSWLFTHQLLCRVPGDFSHCAADSPWFLMTNWIVPGVSPAELFWSFRLHLLPLRFSSTVAFEP